MIKKSLFVLLPLFVFFGITEQCFANPYLQIKLAETYEENEDYEQAEVIYKTIVADYPVSDYALKAQQKLAILYILVERDSEVQLAINKLNSDFSGNSRLPAAIYHIAGKYEWPRKDYDKAETIYQQVIQQHPNSSYAIDARLMIAKMNTLRLIESEQYSAAQSATDKMATDFSANVRLPQMLYNIARRYDENPRKEYEKAKSLCQQIIQRNPSNSFAIRARLDVPKMDILSLVESGEDAAAKAAIDKLITDFLGNSRLPNVVSRFAWQYKDKADEKENQGLAEQAENYRQKAKAIWKIVLEQLPVSGVTAEMCLGAGDCYRKLDEYEKSTVCYQRLVDNYTEHKMAWHALFMVGRNYETLKDSGAISKSEADLKIKAAYEQLLEKYPDCLATNIAKHWLSRNK